MDDTAFAQQGEDRLAKGCTRTGVTGVELDCFESGGPEDTVGDSRFSDPRGAEKKNGGLFSCNQPFIEFFLNEWM